LNRQGHNPRPERTVIFATGLAGAAEVTSSVITLKPASVHGPNEVTIATSVASRPRDAIRKEDMFSIGNYVINNLTANSMSKQKRFRPISNKN